MLVNTDFSVPVSVTPDEYEWSSSPQQGVQRVMLDRVGAENSRAASIVRFGEDVGFPHHSHPVGEEILILDGVFSESGESYSSEWYLRNPTGSSHSPSSPCGTTIFVKRWQMTSKEQPFVRINVKDRSNWYFSEGRDTCSLYKDGSENVLIERLAANVSLFKEPVVGAEVLVLEGSLCDGYRKYTKGSWLRFPSGQHPSLKSHQDGATVYLKHGRFEDLTSVAGIR